MSRLSLILAIFLLCLSAAAQSGLPRRPSIDEVASYLRVNLVEPPEGFISYFWPDEANALRYVDVNGDGEEDLIAEGWLFVAVLLWQDESYGFAFQHIVTAKPDSGAWSKVSFADYNFDTRPEIVFDLRSPHPGQNSGGNRYERSLIHCENECRLIWQETIADYFWVNSREVGIYLYQSDLQAYQREGEIWLELSRRDFAFNCRLSACRVSQENPAIDTFQPASRVGAIIKVRYRWDGIHFNRYEAITLVGSYPMPPQSQLEAGYADKYARIDIADGCQILLNEEMLGATFPCLLDFSRLQWRDVSGDAVPELLLQYAYFDSETLIIYRADGSELGRMVGAIRDADLFGIRVLEEAIFSAGDRYTSSCEGDYCWYELNQESSVYSFRE
jgi:hypothetical protein